MSPIEDAPFPRLGANNALRAGGNGIQLKNLLGQKLIQKSSPSELLTESVTEKTIALYFSASWCPPCRAFTPVLRTVYGVARNRNKSFQVILCSQDRSQAEFEQYWSSMPWPAIPFQNKSTIAALAQRFNLRGIPSIIMINSAGELLNSQSIVAAIRASPDLFIQNLPDSGPQKAAAAALFDTTAIINTEETAGKTLDSVFRDLEHDMTDEIKKEGLATIQKLCENIIGYPENAKFRVIKKTNKTIQKKLSDKRFIHLLKLGGFVEHADDYEFIKTTANEEALSELASLAACVLASFEDSEPPKLSDEQINDKKSDGEDGGGGEWVCEGDVCRRTKN